MRILGSVVLILLLEVLDTREHFGLRRTVTSQPVCDDYTREYMAEPTGLEPATSDATG